MTSSVCATSRASPDRSAAGVSFLTQQGTAGQAYPVRLLPDKTP